MNTASRQLRQYYRQIRAELLCPRTTKAKIINDLKCNISLYLEEHPEATIDDVRSSFGSPAQITASYVEELPTPELIKKLKLRRNILRSVIAVVCGVALIALLLWGGAILVALEKVENRSNSYYEIITEERP